jgi:hypothetical protein
VDWDVTPPKDLKIEAESLAAVANAIMGLRNALQPYGRDVDIVELTNRFGVPVLGDVDGDGTPDVEGATAEATAEAAPKPDAVAETQEAA